MARTASVNKSDLDRAIRAVQSAGVSIMEIVIEPGRVRLVTDSVANPQKPGEGDGILEWPSE